MKTKKEKTGNICFLSLYRLFLKMTDRFSIKPKSFPSIYSAEEVNGNVIGDYRFTLNTQKFVW